MVLKNSTWLKAWLSGKVAIALSFGLTAATVSAPAAHAQFAFGSSFFGTPMFSVWDQADLAKSGTKGYFGGRLTLPEGSDKWPEEFKEQLKQYKISHFASRETIHENEVPSEIKSFPYYEFPTLGTESVKIQMKRVARERGITEEQLEELVKKHEKKSQWAVFIDPWVDIQELNRNLDEVYPIPVPEPKPVQVTKTDTKKKTQVILRKAKNTKQVAKTTKTSTTTAKKTATTKTAKATKSTSTAKVTKTASKTTTASTKTATKTSRTTKTTAKQVANKTSKTVKG